MDNEQHASFSTALEQLYKLHTKEIEDLQTKLALQSEQLQEKERQLQTMKVSVSKAKKKVKQQTVYIQQLESQLGIPHKSSRDKTLNKTAVILFEESPMSVAMSTSDRRRVNPEINTPGGKNHVTTTGEPKIRIEDVGKFSVSAHKDINNAESASDGDSTDVSEDESEVMIVNVDKSDMSTGNETRLVVDAPQTCVSLFEHSITTSPRRPLQLKRASNKSGRIQYKETTNNTSTESSASTNSEDNRSSKRSPSILSETDNSPDFNSPPFIGSSPCKTPPPPNVHNPGMSVSMFQSTPHLEDNETMLKTPSTTGRNLPIPPSDSQFSLDVSQSIPLSPELCGTSTRTNVSLRPKNLKRQLGDVPEKDANSKYRKLESSPTPSVVNPTVIMKTPALPHATVIPVTPGIQTVDNIISKGLGYAKSGTAHGTGHNAARHKKPRPVLIEEKEPQFSQDSEELYSDFDQDEDSPILVYSTTTKKSSAVDTEEVLVDKDEQRKRARELARKAQLPEYPCVTKILGKADRAKLDGKACPECHNWYDGADGIHDGQREHLRHTCRHKHLYQPPDTDPRLWDISMPNSIECDELMDKHH